jgi:hypothetical protein
MVKIDADCIPTPQVVLYLRAYLCGEVPRTSKRKPIPTVDGSGFQAALAATASLQFQGRSSLSLEARCPRASWSIA